MRKKTTATARPFARVANLGRQLAKAEVAPGVRREIMKGADAITQRTPLKRKAEWLADAMDRMDALLPETVRQSVREACACSTTGARLKKIRQLARDHSGLEDFAQALSASHIFGREVVLKGKALHVNFGLERCVCTVKAATRPVSITYCHCCKGHVLRLLGAALGRPLRGEVIGSACSGSPPCRFVVYLD